MKRDLDLIRKVLLYIEEVETFRPVDRIQVNGYSEEQIVYALKMMHQGNLIDAIVREPIGCRLPFIQSIQLTNFGHDYLAAIRNDSIWEKVKRKLVQLGSDVSFEMIKILALQVALTSIT